MHKNINNLPKKILSWYDNNRRTLPWRIGKKSKKNQYYRILSEFMLQQTQVKTVIPYFDNFVKKVPDIETLSKFSEKKILKLWEGLGYYRRVKNLHKTSKILINKYDGKIPRSFAQLKELPGIGDYTASAISSICFGEKEVVIDGNVFRFVSRLFGIKRDIKLKSTFIFFKKKLKLLIEN